MVFVLPWGNGGISINLLGQICTVSHLLVHVLLNMMQQIAVKENRSPRTVGFYSGSGKTMENATSAGTELVINPSKASEKMMSAREDSTVTECTPAMVELETRIAGVQIREDSFDSERNCFYEKDSLEQVSNDTVGKRVQDVVRNGDRVHEESHGDAVNVEWNGDCDDVMCDDDSDSNGWITPENFRQACEEMGGASEERANGVTVGCTTTDFAMQVRERERERERERGRESGE